MTASPGRLLDAHTQLLAVIGDPVAHSASPVMHNEAFAAHDVAAAMIALTVPAGGLAEAIRVVRAAGFVGLSVTTPHKTAIAACCDELSPEARDADAVNCIALQKDRVIGYNTDGDGLLDYLYALGVIDANSNGGDTNLVILGGGGAARAIETACHRRGYRTAVIARDPSKLNWFAPSVSRQVRPWEAARSWAFGSEVAAVIDATTAHWQGNPPALPLQQGNLPPAFVSLAYHAQTVWHGQAAALGIRCIDGAGMLAHQGARAWQHWFGRSPAVDPMIASVKRWVATLS